MDYEQSTLDLYLGYIYSLVFGLINLVFGRFLPTLHPSHKNMRGKNVIITGGNSGIGFAMAKQLAKMHAEIYLACRSHERGSEAIKALKEYEPKAQVHLLQLDNGSLESVRAFADEWASLGKRIDVLVHNAGTGTYPGGQEFTKDGLETIYQINFLSSFLLTRLVEPFFTSNTRVIFTTAPGHYAASVWPSSFNLSRGTETVERGFHYPTLAYKSQPSLLYSQTKLMQIALARALHERWSRNYAAVASMSMSTKIATSFSPGYTSTNIFQKSQDHGSTDLLYKLLYLGTYLATSPDQGAATGTFLATANNVEPWVSYWERMSPRTSGADFMTEETLRKLWLRWSADAGIDP